MITGALGALILLLGCWAQHLGHEEAKAKWTTLGEWLALRGGYLHRGLEPSLVSHGGLSMMGIVSTVLLPEGAVAIELPRLALLDLELLGSIPEYLDLASSTPSCSISSGFQRSMRNLKLLTILAREKAKGPASDFASYLELLPSKVNLEESDVYYAGEDLLKDFKVLPVINFWRRIQAEHYKELESCFEALKMQRPMETAGVLWKDVEVLLRTHRSRYFAISQPSLEFLGPGADWVNTGTRTEQNVKAVLTISGKHQEMTLQFVASRDLKPGEELILSYFTGLDNEDILFRWNMYLEGNDISLDAGDTATVCSAGGQDLRSASLEMLDLNVERQVPRCRDSGKRQGVLRCSLARLAYELCVGSWFPERSAVNPAPQTPASRSKGDRVAGYLIMYSMILRSRGDRAGAKEALNDLFSRAEKGLAAASLVDAHLQMAEWLLEEEELQESEKHILAAMRVREEAKAYFNHGLIFLARGDSLNALQSFRRGRQLSEPGSAVEAECARMLQKSLGALGLTGPSATRTERAHPLYYNQSNVLSTLLVG